MRIIKHERERRKKKRFGIRRELRYKLLEDRKLTEIGTGYTLDIGSGGVAFTAERTLPIGAFVELSISWPVLLDETCGMRLVVIGRVLRSDGGMTACRTEKYEFRTQARAAHSTLQTRNDSMLLRWADTIRRGGLRAAGAAGA